MSPTHSFRLAGVLLLFAGCGGGGLPPVDVPADFAADPGVRTLIDERVDAVRSAPSSAEAHLDLGLALAANGGGELAAASFAKAIELDPALAEAHYQLARRHAERGDDGAQEASLIRALECDAALVAARYDLACAHLDGGDVDLAEAGFQRILTQVPEAPMARMGLGLVDLERGDLKRGIERLIAVLEELPDEPFVRFRLGQAYARFGDETKASLLLAGVSGSAQRPRVNSPGDRRAERFEIGRSSRLAEANALLGAGDHERALPGLKQLYASSPEDFEVALSLAAALVEGARPAEAIPVLEKAESLRPGHHIVAVQRASCALLTAGTKRKAGDRAGSAADLRASLEWAERALARAEDFGKAHARRGAALAGLNRDGEALEAYRRAIELGETHEGLYVEMIAPARRYGGPALAESVLREGIGGRQDRLRLRFELCGVLLQDGRGAAARAAQREMARVAPGSALTRRADQILSQRGH